MALTITLAFYGGKFWRVVAGRPAVAAIRTDSPDTDAPEAVTPGGATPSDLAPAGGALRGGAPGGQPPDAAAEPTVDLERILLARAPAWVSDVDILVSLREVRKQVLSASRAPSGPSSGPAEGGGPWGDRGQVSLLDLGALRGLQQALQDLPWVEEARVTRRFPDRLGVQLHVRKPVLRLTDADGRVWLLDRNVRCLPAAHGAGEELPAVELQGVWAGPGSGELLPPARSGGIHPDPRARAAVAVLREWQEQLLPLMAERDVAVPRVLSVDPYNLGGHMLSPLLHPEVRVVLAGGGAVPVAGADMDPAVSPQPEAPQSVSLAYGRPPGAKRSRVPVAVKAEVLGSLLAAFPGLRGCTGADLRYANRWREYVLPTQGLDPFAADAPNPTGPGQDR